MELRQVCSRTLSPGRAGPTAGRRRCRFDSERGKRKGLLRDQQDGIAYAQHSLGTLAGQHRLAEGLSRYEPAYRGPFRIPLHCMPLANDAGSNGGF